MIVTEVIIFTRNCCTEKDIQRVGKTDVGHCVHCGQKHMEKSYTDAAGDTDLMWVKTQPATPLEATAEK